MEDRAQPKERHLSGHLLLTTSQHRSRYADDDVGSLRGQQ